MTADRQRPNDLAGELAELHLNLSDRLETGEEPVTVLLRSDEGMPLTYAVRALHTVFGLSHELAEHAVGVARARGRAPFLSLPRAKAEQLVREAHLLARLDGLPAVFRVEEELRCESGIVPRRLPLWVLGLLLALAVALADRGGL
jgi:ATP-dependent Clp protease adapter protein ClpS